MRFSYGSWGREVWQKEGTPEIDPGYFRKHLAAHQGGRPFRCSSCGEGFANTYGLKKHRLAHKAEGLGGPGAGAGTLAGKDA